MIMIITMMKIFTNLERGPAAAAAMAAEATAEAGSGFVIIAVTWDPHCHHCWHLRSSLLSPEIVIIIINVIISTVTIMTTMTMMVMVIIMMTWFIGISNPGKEDAWYFFLMTDSWALERPEMFVIIFYFYLFSDILRNFNHMNIQRPPLGLIPLFRTYESNCCSSTLH